MSRQIILNFLNFLLTIIKKCATILGWRAGCPRRLVDNLWISRFYLGRLCTCFTFPLWRRRITLTLITFPLWRRSALWDAVPKFRAGGVLQYFVVKKSEGWEFLHLLKFPCPHSRLMQLRI